MEVQNIEVDGISVSLVSPYDDHTILLALNENEDHRYHAVVQNNYQGFVHLYPMLEDEKLPVESLYVLLFGRYKAKWSDLLTRLESLELRKKLLAFSTQVLPIMMTMNIDVF